MSCNMLRPKASPILDEDSDSSYLEDVQELYDNYQSESPDYFLIETEV